LFSVT